MSDMNPTATPDPDKAAIDELSEALRRYLTRTDKTPGEVILDVLEDLAYDQCASEEDEDAVIYLLLDGDDATLRVEVG